jgi:hypothetical protein
VFCSLPLGGEGWGGGLRARLTIAKRPLNLVQHSPSIFIEFLIAKANDSESARGEASGSARIVVLAFRVDVLRSVKLDN